MVNDVFEINGKTFGVERAGPGVAEEQIARLDAQTGCSLPAQLRSYYKRWNGGLVFPIGQPNFSSLCVRLFWHEEAPAASSGTIASVSSMLRIDGEVNDFAETWTTFKDRFPKDLLCFQRDPGGSLYLIGTGPQNLGRIYFWDRGYEADEGEAPSYDNIADVAPSFVDFLMALRDEPGTDETDVDWIRRNYPE